MLQVLNHNKSNALIKKEMTKNTTIITGGEGTNRDLGIGEKVLENCKLIWQKKLRLISKKNTSTAPLNYPLPCRMNVSSLTPVSAFHLVLTLFLNTSIIKKKPSVIQCFFLLIWKINPFVKAAHTECPPPSYYQCLLC